MAMTVADLRSALKGFPDHWPVSVHVKLLISTFLNDVDADFYQTIDVDDYAGVDSVDIGNPPNETITHAIIRM